MAQRTLTTIVR